MPTRPGLGPTVALQVLLALGASAVLMALAFIVRHPVPLPEPFPSLGIPSQNQRAETLAFALVFAVALPAALVAGSCVARTIAAGPNGRGLGVLTGLLAAAMAALLLALRLAGALGVADGVRTLAVVAALWLLLAAGALARAARPRPWPALQRVAARRAHAWVAAAILAFGVVVALTAVHALSLVGLVVGAALAALALLALARGRVPRPRRRWLLLVDAVVLALVLLAVPDLVVVRPEDAGGNFAEALQVGVLRFHQDFLLGPANQVLHGGAMLVDTASQYGVGSVYALVGWFKIAPIGYGTLSLVDAVGSALWFGAAYGVLRLSRTPRTLSAAALALGVVALVLHLAYPVGSLPQDGPLRFGLPMVVLLARVIAVRRPGWSGAGRVAAAAAVGLSAIWSLEALASTVAVFGAMVLLEAWLRPAGARLRWAGGQAALAAGCALVAHVVLALATLAATGELPDWGIYLGFLHEFLVGPLGNFTYDVARWSPALGVAVLYVASAAAVVEIARRRGDLVERERPAIVALGGMTVYGIVLFYYFVDRSEPHILLRVGLPALVVAPLWLGLVLRQGVAVSAVGRWSALVLALSVATLMLSAAWPSIGNRLPRSALAHVVPGGEGLRAALHRLWHLPPLDRSTAEGARLLQRDMPGETHSLVFTPPDRAVEILLRAGRADRLRLGDPTEANYVPFDELPRLRPWLAGLRPGDRMLLDGAGQQSAAAIRSHPGLDPLGRVSSQELQALATGSGGSQGHLGALQQWTLRWILQRFRLRTVDRDALGFSVVELERR